VTSVLTALLVISYANRATGAQFGLDQINSLLATYLAVGPSGDWLGVDQWRRQRQGRGEVRTSVLANIAIRLIQVHVSVIYLFAGLGKLQGESWWNGQAIWYAVANLEYQTLDLTWLADHMWLVNLMTWGAVAWETSYPFLVWPRLTRPLMLAGAVLVHLGIGLAMGMMTFGLAMIIANLAFVPASAAGGLCSRSKAVSAD
jgi:sulfite exporter TauE/SafE